MFNRFGFVYRLAKERVDENKTSAVLKDELSEARLRYGSSVVWHIEPPGARVVYLKFELLPNPSNSSNSSEAEAKTAETFKSEVRAEPASQINLAALMIMATGNGLRGPV